MRPLHMSCAFVAAIVFSGVSYAADGQAIPTAWVAAWKSPGTEHRPLQIVHGLPANRISVEGMRYYKDLGLGGLVTNVHFDQYLQSEERWKALVGAIDSMQKLGLRAWIYDEQGYPSGAAGGLVLKESPDLQAAALFYDAAAKEPFRVGPVFEFTHASNNVFACRRYINLLDARATESFLKKTHDAYWQRVQGHFGKTIAATFTDEPSLMAVYLGKIPPNAAKHVRVDDPIDPNVQMLPCVPWGPDIAEQYSKRYGHDLLAVRKSLFEGESPADKQVRRRFWNLVGDLVADRYYGRIQQWCRAHGVASSGHKLHEESLIHHVPLDGNGLKVLMRMDVPGLDMLSSSPQAVLGSGWITAGLPCSAALLTGGRRVMTEISDYSEKVREKGPATLEEMCAAAAWQAAWGVTEFTLYYSIKDRPEPQHKAYCDYVGRLNAILRDASPQPQALLYYPICDLWAEYKPIDKPLNIGAQNARARQLVQSFGELGRALQGAQVPFMLVDHEQLATAKVKDSAIELAGRRFKAVLIPQNCELPPAVEAVQQTGGQWLRHEQIKTRMSPEGLAKIVDAQYRLSPPSNQVVLGQFAREGRQILLLVNVGDKPYQGVMQGFAGRAWQSMDPEHGTIAPIVPAGDGKIKIELGPRRAVVLVGG